MRNGPLVHRHARVSKAVRGTATPLERLAALKVVGKPGEFRKRNGGGLPEAGIGEWSRLEFGSRLPINLRKFLAKELGPHLKIEDDGIVVTGPRSGEAMMRDLARAIRRFSAERAHQVWSECAIGLNRFRNEFFRAPTGQRCPVILCLRCACIGAGPLDEHGGPDCLPVNLDSALKDFRVSRISSRCSHAPDSILQAIENFRVAREAVGAPHYDLDCFISKGQLVFTWRPLPEKTRS